MSHDGLIKLMKELFISSMLCKAALHICAALVDACATMANSSVERIPPLDPHGAHIRKASNGRLLADDTYVPGACHEDSAELQLTRRHAAKACLPVVGHLACGKMLRGLANLPRRCCS